MMDSFPTKKKGDDLEAELINKLTKVARIVSGRGPASFVGSIGGVPIGEAPFIQRVIEVVTGKDTSTNLYQCRTRYYDFTNNRWVTDSTSNTYDLDMTALGQTASVGQILVAYWDPQRNAFIGIESVGTTTVTSGPASGCNLFDCLDPSGSNLDPYCHTCTCTANPWVLIIPNSLICGGATIAREALLYFSKDLSGGGYGGDCVWVSHDIKSNSKTFFWKLTVHTSKTAKIELIQSPSTVLASWSNEGRLFCCFCANLFIADCPGSVPVPCSGLPGEICIVPPVYEILKVPFSACNSNTPPFECPDNVMAAIWDLTFSGLTNGTICDNCDTFNGVHHLINGGPCTTFPDNVGVPNSCYWFECSNFGNPNVTCDPFEAAAAGFVIAGDEEVLRAWCAFFFIPGGMYLHLDTTLVRLTNTNCLWEYTMPRADFVCMGPNTLTLTPEILPPFNHCNGMPATITITAGSGLVVDGVAVGPVLIPKTDTEFPPCGAATCSCCIESVGSEWEIRDDLLTCPLSQRTNCYAEAIAEAGDASAYPPGTIICIDFSY